MWRTPWEPVAMNVQALRGLVDHGLERFEHLGIGQPLDHMIFVAEQEMQ